MKLMMCYMIIAMIAMIKITPTIVSNILTSLQLRQNRTNFVNAPYQTFETLPSLFWLMSKPSDIVMKKDDAKEAYKHNSFSICFRAMAIERIQFLPL